MSLSVDEAATQANVHRNTIYRALLAGNLPASKAGGRWSIAPDALSEWSDEWRRRLRGLNPTRIMPGESTLDFTRAMMKSRESFDFELHAAELARVYCDDHAAGNEVTEVTEVEHAPASSVPTIDMSVLIP